MTKFVKHCRDFIEGEQSRLARFRLRNVEMIGHDWFHAQQIALTDVGIHPGAAALRCARIIIAQEKRERLTVFVENFECAHVRLINRNVVTLLESETVKLVRGVKDAVVQNVIDLEMRFDLRFVVSVTRLPNFLGVKAQSHASS